ERGEVVALLSAPAHEHGWEIPIRIGAEADSRATGEVMVDVALEVDRPGEPLPGRDQRAPAAGVGAGFDRGGDGAGAIGSVVGDGAVVADVEDAGGKSRRGDGGHRERRRDVRSDDRSG